MPDRDPMRRDQASLLTRVVHAGVWSVALRSALRSMAFIRNVVLARVLAPDDIGLFGMALVVLSIIERFSNTGLTAALVQKNDSIDDDLHTAWTVQLLRGTALATVLLLGAPAAAGFFGEAAVAPLIRTLALAVLIRSLKNPGIIQLQRELDVRRQFLIRSGGASSDLLVSIAASIALRNAWGLMLGLVAGSLVNLVLSYALQSFRPRPRLDIGQLRVLGGFGIWVFLNDVLFFLAYRGDNLVVGKVLGSAALGAYILAYSISEVLTVEVGRIFSEVGFPAYSRMQGEVQQLRRALRYSNELVTSLTFPLAAVLFLLATPIVALVLGERWGAAALVLPPLAIAGALRAWIASAGAAFKAVGKPRYTFGMNLVGVGMTYTLLFPLLSRDGLVGVGWAIAGGMLAAVPLALLGTRQLVGPGLREQLGSLLPAGVLTLAAATPIVLMGPGSGPADLAIRLFAVVCAYLGVCGALWVGNRSGPVALVMVLLRVRSPRRPTVLDIGAPKLQPLERLTPGE